MTDKAICPHESTFACRELDRRALVRYPCIQETSCHFIVSSRYESQWARVHDVSTGGVGLAMERQIEPETLLLVELRTERGRYARGVLARVVHATPQADGTWFIGCSFVHRLSDTELEALL